MKRKLLFLLILSVFLQNFIYTETNSKEGYFDLKWGSTVADAEDNDYELVFADEKTASRLINSFAITEPVDFYTIEPDTSKITECVLAYYRGKLFMVFEIFNYRGNQKQLERRYGNFEDSGIIFANNVFMDQQSCVDGIVQEMSIIISPNNDKTANVLMFDKETFQSVCKKSLSQNSMNTTCVNDLSRLADRLLKDVRVGTKFSYAFLPLISDSKNVFIESYITDALTEAAFNTGKIKIIERANLETVIKEQKLQASGYVSDDTAKSIGCVAGVDFVCYGTITDAGQNLIVSVRIVDVESGEICAMSRESILKDDYILHQTNGQ